MDKQSVKDSILLKKRFCKDSGLPIAVYDNPYFNERLHILNSLYGCEESYKIFCSEVESFANEQEYFEYYNSLKNRIIDHIKNQPTFTAFTYFNKDTFLLQSAQRKRNLYVEENDNSTFISIDMRKANFSALNHYSKDIFNGAETWEDFIKNYTTLSHIINSKYIRQVILGACNPKKQIHYEHYLMSILAEHIKESLNVDIYSLGEDEILIKVMGKCAFSLKKLKEVIKTCPGGIGNLVRVEMFDLERIQGTTGWLKRYYSFEENNSKERVEFKCLGSDVFHQVVKHYFGKKITENDLVFNYNGKLASFLQEVNNPWST